MKIGLDGEVYPIKKERFDECYSPLDEVFDEVFDYPPSIINISENKTYSLMTNARKCMSSPGGKVFARPLEKHVKVFTRWNYETYMGGRPGDMLCYSTNDDRDVYVVRKESFGRIYEESEL